MKLSTPLVQSTLRQLEGQRPFEDAQAIPDDHPAVPQLTQVFGEHTFFVDSGGLHIVEPAGDAGEAEGGKRGQMVKLAGWDDETHTQLAIQEPEPTDVVVRLALD